jgi:hypothetical protein
MAGLYEIIGDLRREYQTPSASKTLDLVVAELGRTQDNLGQALARLDGQAIPSGGRPVLEELEARARAEGVDDLSVPLSPAEIRESLEPIGIGQLGIAFVMGGTALAGVVLAAWAIAATFVH